MDTYSFRVYQIELSQAGNVSVISSTVRESDTDIVVEEFDPIERSVEFEDNLYKLDNTEMVVSGLPESYFKSYSTADDVDGGNYKPFIAEIRKGPQSSWNSNEVLFHGLIDPSSVRFSQRTERTQFKVWSWDRVISEAGKVPARSVLEADIAEMPDYKDITEGQVTIKVADGDVRRGDIAEFQVETKGPVRSPVRDIRTKPGKEYQEIDVAVPIGDNPDIENKTPDNDPNQDAPFYPDGQGRFTLRFNEKPIEGRDGTSVYDLIYDGEGKRVYLRLTNKNTGNRYILTFEPANNDALVLGDNYRELRLNNTIFLSLPGFDLPDDPSNLRVDFYGKKLFKGIGDSIKFYGRSAYGYDPTDGGTNPEAEFVIAGTDSNGDPEGLIPAIFSLSGSGYLDTLESVVDTFVVPSEGEEDYIEDRQTFPTDLEKSLRAIARSAPVYVNLVPTKDANDPSLPRLEVRVTPRSLAVNQNPDVFDGIVKEWNENVIDEPLNAVKITTEGIGKPEGYGPLAGWYPAQNVGNGTIYQVKNNTILVDYYDPKLSDGDTVRIDGKNEGKQLPNKVTVDSVAGVYSIGGGGINSMKINTKESIPDIGPGVNGYGRARWRLVGSSMPDGDSEVVEFETLTWPSFSGPEIADGDDRVVKDSQLSTVARYYYEFLKQLGAKGSATLEGTYPNIVGDKLEFSVPKYETEEGTEVNRVAYVTKTEVDYEKKETEIEFRRGTFTEPDGSALIPRIEVQDTAFVRSGNTTSVAFDAEKTSAPAGSDYLWEVDTTGDGTYDATASSKYFSLDLGVGNYDWKFTVTTPDGQTRTDTGSVAVAEDPVEDYQKPFVDFDAYEIDGNPRKGRLDVIVGGDGRAPESVYIMAKQSGNLPDQPGVPDASKSYVHENPNATTLSNGRTRYRYTIDLAEGHISEMQGYVQHPSNRAVAPDISEQFQFDANDKPAPSYSWNWEYRSSADNYDLYLVWSGSVDTASVKFLFHQDGDTSTAPNNTVTADGRNGRVKVNGSPISSNAEIAVEAKAFNEPGQTGAEESDSPTFNISSPLGGDSIDTGGLDDRYLLESGDRINGPLEFGTAGEIAEGSGSYLEVLAADGTNSGELHLDTLVVDQLDVTGDINQQNENNLAVEDRWIETNVGGGDQDAGVIVNRSATDAYLMWDEGTDLFGRRFGSGGTFKPFVLEDGSRWGIDIWGDADTLDGTHLSDITFADIAATRYTDAEAVSAVGASVPFENSDLKHSTVEVAGNTVALGTSTGIAHADISAVDSDDHHPRYTDSEAVGAVESHGDALTIDITGDADTVDQYGGNDLAVLDENETITAGWVHKADITLDGASLQTSGAATGQTGTGAIVQSGKSWFDDLGVRGVLSVPEFEAKQVTVSKGEKAFGPGGGKVVEVVSYSSGTSCELRFADNPGIKSGDRVLIREVDPATANVRKVELKATGNGTSITFDIVSESGGPPQKGDSVAVIGSSDTSRDSLLYANPYGPYFDVLDGISTFSDWNSRSPKARYGYIGGAPNLSNGTSPSGYGIWSTNAYLEGAIVANSGKIADSVTIGGTQAKNLAADSDLFSGDYNDLTGTPTLGDVASLNDIDSTYISDGAVVTAKIASGAITTTELSADAVTATEIAIGSVTDIDSDAATINDVFSGNYSDLSGKPSLGDVASLDNVSSTYISDGAVVTRTVASNAITTSELKADAVTATEISIGSVTDIDTDAATISDVFSGNYGDLSGKPSLGDVASLNNISSTYISDGAVVTRTIASGSVTATEANLSDIFAQTLTLNSGGTIRSSGTTGSTRNFAINADGSGQFAAGKVSWDTNGAVSIGYTSARHIARDIHMGGDRAMQEGRGRGVENGLMVRLKQKSPRWGETNATSQEEMVEIQRTGQYYASREVSNLDWGEQGQGSNNDIDTPGNAYASETFGWFYMGETGTWDIAIDSDDTSELFIDGERVDYWLIGGRGQESTEAQNNAGTFNVPSTGWYRIYVRHEEGSGGSGVRMYVKRPSESSFSIPSNSEFRRRKTAGDGRVFIEDGTITANEIDADAVTANEISIGSVTDIDSDAATINDVFSGNYSDLSGKPSLGDVASLNNISSTYIADGAVVTRTIATDAITADEANFNDLNAVAASIAGWDINSNSIRRYNLSDTNEDVAIGETFFDDHYGISVGKGGNNYARLITHPSGGYELDVKGNDGADQVYIGNGYNFSNMGMLVKADNTTIFKTSPTTAYIDNLEVRNGATIDGGVTVSGGFSGDQIDVTDLSAVNTNTGSLDVDGTLTMNGGKITNGNTYRIDDTAIQIKSNSSYTEANAITFVDELQDAPISSSDIGRMWFDSAKDELVVSQNAPASGRLLLRGQNNVDIESQNGPIRFFPENNIVTSGGARVVDIPNTQSYGQDGTGIVLSPYESEYGGDADKSDLEDVMGPNEGLIYTMLYPDGNINLAWAETDSNGNIQNRGNTF
ncbi:PA14 glucosidase domain-containing protein [Salinibacter virus M31CR41-3]|nr:PA14 glucosidase domain-containing protein [Salinibacter virus M31CR41-3]